MSVGHPDFSRASYDPRGIVAGDYPLASVPITLAEGQNLPRGAVLGKIRYGAWAFAVTQAGANKHTVAVDADTGVTNPVLGAYSVVNVVAPVANPAAAGKYELRDGTGKFVALLTGGVKAHGVTVTDGANTAVGDVAYITASRAAGSGQHVLSVAAATDGSEVPDGILVEDTDATDDATATSIYVSGQFDAAMLTYGAGHTAASVRASLAGKPIWIKDAIGA
jgi:hypothetical protein